jgi:hypothetical protein
MACVRKCRGKWVVDYRDAADLVGFHAIQGGIQIFIDAAGDRLPTHAAFQANALRIPAGRHDLHAEIAIRHDSDHVPFGIDDRKESPLVTVIIDQDHINEDKPEFDRSGTVLEETPLYGVERVMGIDPAIPAGDNLVKFRLFDDDGELYYEGRLTDDDECENQSAALRFGEADAGCTTILVLRGHMWTQEIG